jgi:hypothetical protein
MSRLFTRRIAVSPTPNIKSRTWWHGTTKEAADNILKEGLKSKDISFEAGQMEPQKGRIYFANSIKQALSYSVTRISQVIDDDNLYIFEIPGSAFNDLTMDEDSIADIILCYYDMDEGVVSDVHNTTPLTFRKEVAKNRALVRRLIDTLDQNIKDYKFHSILQGLFEKKSVFYDDLVWYAKKAIEDEIIPDSLTIQLIETMPSAITSDGVIWPTKLYIIPWVWNHPDSIKDVNSDSLMKYWNSVKDQIKVVDVTHGS